MKTILANTSKYYPAEISERNEEHIIENWRKRNPCYKVAKDLAELYSCPIVL
jgi:hypothetical protein